MHAIRTVCAPTPHTCVLSRGHSLKALVFTSPRSAHAWFYMRAFYRENCHRNVAIASVSLFMKCTFDEAIRLCWWRWLGSRLSCTALAPSGCSPSDQTVNSHTPSIVQCHHGVTSQSGEISCRLPIISRNSGAERESRQTLLRSIAMIRAKGASRYQVRFVVYHLDR